MKKYLFLLLLILGLGSAASAQTSVTGQIMEGPAAVRPASCASGDIYFATDTFVMYQCGPTNIWSTVAVNVQTFAGVPTGACSSNQLAVDTTTGFLYTCLSSAWKLVNAITLQTNGVNNGSQIKLNLINGVGISIVDGGSGGITINVQNVPWTSLSGFPAACTSGQFVTTVGTVLTCAAPSGSTASNNIWTGTNTFNNSITGVHPPCNPQSFSATPTFNVAFDSCVQMVLTGNITAITISGPPANHTVLYLQLPQDSVGNRTVSWPANFHFPTGWTLSSAANSTNYLGWSFDGTFWQPLVAFGGSSGGSSPAGTNGAVQIQQGGTLGATGNVFDFGNLFSINEDSAFLQNPYTDFRQFGGAKVPQNQIPTATASCAGTNQLALSGISFAGFQNTNGVFVPGCGPTVIVAAPTITSVTPINPTDALNTNHVVANTSGASNICFEIAIVTTGYGVTAASPQVCTAQAAATLGQATGTITNCSRTNATVTCTGTNFGFVAGTRVFISGTSDPGQFEGFPIVTSVTGTTTFTYTSPLDSRAGADTSSTGGTVLYENGVQIAFPPSPGGNAFLYAIYETSPVARFLGFSWPVGLENGYTDPSYGTFTYYGTTLSPAFVPPAWFPTTPPVSALNEAWTGSIVSGANGTTNATVTMSTSAVQTFSTTAYFDDSPALIAANGYVANTGGGSVYIPAIPAGFYYPIQAFTPLTTNLRVGGSMTLNGTIQTTAKIIGEPNTPCVNPSFALACNPSIGVGQAYPGIWTKTGQIRGVGISGSQNGGLKVLDTTFNTSFNYTDVSLSDGSNADCMGLLFLGWGTSGGAFGGVFNNVSETVGPNPQVGGGCPSFAMFIRNNTEINFNEFSMNRRGLGFQLPDFGLALTFNQGQEQQGAVVPTIAFTRNRSGNNSGLVRISGTNPDTEAVATIANWTGVGGFGGAIYLENVSPPSSNQALITGKPFMSIHVNGYASTNLGQNVNINPDNYASAAGTIDGNFSSGGAGASLSPTRQYKPFILGPGFQLFSTTLRPAAPTCTPQNSPSGSLGAGSHTIFFRAVYDNATTTGGEGEASYSCTFTVTASQSVQISNATVSGFPTGFDIYFDGFLANAGGCVPPQVPSFPYNFVGGTCGNSATNFPGTGLVGINGQTLYSFALLTTGYQDFTQTTAGAIGNPPSGKCRNYFDSGSGTMKAINSSGSTCSGSGGGSGLWNSIGNPNGNLALTMYSGSTNFTSNFHFIGTGSLASAFGWSNDSAATSGTSQGSPQLFLCGNAWHASSSVSSCLNIQLIPGNGTDANGSINFTRTGSDTGIYQSNFPGPVASGASGSGVGGEIITPEGTLPSGLCTVGQDNLYADSTSHHLLVCANGGSIASSTTSPTTTVTGNVPIYSNTKGDLAGGLGVQGTDPSVLTSGTLPGAVGSTICKDANGGATTVGCAGGGGGGSAAPVFLSNVYNDTRYQTVDGFYSTSTVTIANSGSNTSLISTPNGFQAIPGNSMLPLGTGYKTYQFTANGTISTLGSTPGNIVVTVVLGGVTIDTITLASANVPTSLSSAAWSFEYKISVTSNAAVNGGGCLEIINASNAAIKACSSVSNATGLNFLTAQTADLKWQWATPSSSNSVTANVVKGIPLQRF